jgi:hypothetical protein
VEVHPGMSRKFEGDSNEDQVIKDEEEGSSDDVDEEDNFDDLYL